MSQENSKQDNKKQPYFSFTAFMNGDYKLMDRMFTKDSSKTFKQEEVTPVNLDDNVSVTSDTTTHEDVEAPVHHEEQSSQQDKPGTNKDTLTWVTRSILAALVATAIGGVIYTKWSAISAGLVTLANLLTTFIIPATATFFMSTVGMSVGISVAALVLTALVIGIVQGSKANMPAKPETTLDPSPSSSINQNNGTDQTVIDETSTTEENTNKADNSNNSKIK